ncbi:hypothetical protein AQ490_13445 [Wenjunlia vitaminophila]|uniref:FAD/NAD(P)-binding domain-containing protein n=1 Tax=Wenjunlia vitaminophila TaxID=76728 RepID=A0A0T6LXU2_WENVI|nr:FAD-dependent oxidoreductase [Wenjunlia vitaminophila]KRV50939.1 hypothetical protein AQ490_13445 [Wenjunlia vitaminophila]
MDQHIVVLGAGYAGMMAALRLAPRHRVTVIDAATHFTERVRLHELAAGRTRTRIPITELASRGSAPGPEPVTGHVVGIDLQDKVIHTRDGGEYFYDKLVYALGSHTDTTAPGVAEHAYTVERARELRARLAGQEHGTLAVVGGGLTGTELAAALAEAYPGWRVRLVTSGEPVPGLSERGRAHVLRALDRLGVEVLREHRALAVDEHGVHTGRGLVPADAVAWAASFTVPNVAARSGLAVYRDGRAMVDQMLRSVSHPDVWVVGDAAALAVPRAGVIRMACMTAMPVAAHAADTINALTSGQEPKPFRFRYLVQCVSLGRRDGVIQPVRADDCPLNWVLTGRTAAWVKERMCRLSFLALQVERRRPGSFSWPRHSPLGGAA